MTSRLIALLVVVAAAGCAGSEARLTRISPAETTTSTAVGLPGTPSVDPTTAAPGAGGSDPTTGATAPTPDADPAACSTISAAFSQIAANAATMTPADAEQAIEQMKSVLPDSLHDDLDGVISASQTGDRERAAQSMQAISQYVAAVCTPG